MYKVLILLSFCLFQSCVITESEKLEILLQKWNGKEIYFPKKALFTFYGERQTEFNISKSGYKIVHYIDSIGCTSCKLDLNKWKEYIAYMDSVTNHTVSYVFFIHTKQKREIKIALKESKFEYPICLDMENEFGRLNNIPMISKLQTFLLDKDNRIIGMGDPVKNARVRELYLNLINGEQVKREMDQIRTIAELSHKEVDFGKFSWDVRVDTVLDLKNVGQRPLIIHDIETSCGCTVAAYDKHPVQPGESLCIKVSFKADRPEYFHKNIIVHCNTEDSPLIFWVKGHAKQID